MKLDKSKKSSNGEGVRKAERPQRPGQYGGEYRDKKASRPVPGGVQGASSLSQALMGKNLPAVMEDTAKRDKVNAAKAYIGNLKKNPNPFAKARGK